MTQKETPTTTSSRQDVWWTSLQFLFLVSMFFPPDFLLPDGIPREIPSADALTLLSAVFGALAVLLGIQSFLELGTSFNFLPRPSAGSSLKTGGAYSLVRHPMYSSQVLFFLCFALVSGSTMRVAITVLLGMVLSAKAGMEEEYLVERYGEEYKKYQEKVKKLVPFLY